MRERRTTRFRSVAAIASVVLLSVVAACSSDGSEASDTSSGSDGGSSSSEELIPLTIGYSAWPGWFPLAVAEEAGIFTDAGLDVELKYFPDYIASLDALVAEQVDVNAQTLNDTIFSVATGADQQVIVVNDNSTGNDQIICDSSITSIKDMTGKSVAAEAGVVDHFLLLQGLADEGMTQDDIQFSGVPTADAAAAFAGGEFDCVGVFAPFTLTAMERPGAKVLFSSADYPGAIPDHLVATGKAAEDTEAMQRLVNAWYMTLDYIDQNPDEALAIMSDKAGISTEEYKEFEAGTTIFSAEDAVNAFGDRPDDPTSLPYMASQINPFLVSSGLAEEEADLDGLFAPQYTEAYVKGG